MCATQVVWSAFAPSQVSVRRLWSSVLKIARWVVVKYGYTIDVTFPARS